MNHRNLRQIFQKIQVIRAPKHRLATFGASKINYKLVSDVPGLPDRSRLREGLVTAEKPAIITPNQFKELFQGFSDNAGELADWLVSQYGEALRGLEYQFRNEPQSSRVELLPPDTFSQQLAQEFDRQGAYSNVLLRGPDKMWELSIMKFIVEITLSSFSSNIQELNERGFFDGGERALQQRHREVQALLQRARTDSSLVPVIGKKLKDYGLFEQYQDAFFQLLTR